MISEITEKVSLKIRPLQQADASSLAFHANNINVWRGVRDSFPYPYLESDAAAFIDHTLRHSRDTTFALEVNGEAAGVVSIIPKKDIYRINGEIGYWLGQKYWNRGIVTKAIGFITDLGLKRLQLHRVYAEVMMNNPASGRVLEKNGFYKEAIFKEAVIKEGELRDVGIYSKFRE